MARIIRHWSTEPVPAELEVRQIYAFIINNEGQVFCQSCDGKYNLPGGKPEIGEADHLVTLKRECLEESNITFTNPRYLGFLKVEENEQIYAQVRYAADFLELGEVRPDPDTGREYGRIFIEVNDLNEVLQWGEHGKAQISSLTDSMNSNSDL